MRVGRHWPRPRPELPRPLGCFKASQRMERETFTSEAQIRFLSWTKREYSLESLGIPGRVTQEMADPPPALSYSLRTDWLWTARAICSLPTEAVSARSHRAGSLPRSPATAREASLETAGRPRTQPLGRP